MFKLKAVRPDEAQGEVKKAYDVFPPEMGVPEPIQLYSASPALLNMQMESLRYFMNHSRLEFPLLAAIRFMAANEFCFDYCSGLNAQMLKRIGMSEQDMLALTGDLEGLPFEENEIVLLKLVRKVITNPNNVTQEEVDACRAAGWEDADILDASMHAAVMQVGNRLMTAFRSQEK